MDYVSKTTHDGRNVRVKDYKKRIRRNRRRRRALAFAFLLLCLSVFLGFAPLFSVSEVVCTGNEKVSDSVLFAASTVSIGYNIFRTSTAKAERLVSAIPYIKSAEVRRRLPNKIEIRVVESSVHGYIPLEERYIYIDESGKMLELAQTPPDKAAPVVQGTGVTEFKGGQTAAADNAAKIPLLAACLTALDANGAADKITIVDITDTERLTIYYNNSLKILVGGIKDIDYRIAFAMQTINEKLGANPKGFLDIRTPAEAIHRDSAE